MSKSFKVKTRGSNGKQANLQHLRKVHQKLAADRLSISLNNLKYNVQCPHCDTKVSVPAGLSQCPNCGGNINIKLNVDMQS